MRYYVNEGSSAYSPVLSQCDEETHWFHGDALGSTVGLTDASGGQTDTFLYDGLGALVGGTGTTDSSMKYQGASGLYTEAALGLVQAGVYWTQSTAPADMRLSDILAWLRKWVNIEVTGNVGFVKQITAGYGTCWDSACNQWGYTESRDCWGITLQANLTVNLVCGHVDYDPRGDDNGGNRGLLERLADTTLTPVKCPPESKSAEDTVSVTLPPSLVWVGVPITVIASPQGGFDVCIGGQAGAGIPFTVMRCNTQRVVFPVS